MLSQDLNNPQVKFIKGILLAVDRVGLFIEDILAAVMSRPICYFTMPSVMRTLEKEKLLNHNTLLALIENSSGKPVAISNAIISFSKRDGKITENDLKLITDSRNPEGEPRVIACDLECYIKERTLLSAANIELLRSHKDITLLSVLIKHLDAHYYPEPNKAHFNQTVIQTLLLHADFNTLYCVFENLTEKPALLNPFNLNMLLNHPNPEAFSKALLTFAGFARSKGYFPAAVAVDYIKQQPNFSSQFDSYTALFSRLWQPNSLDGIKLFDALTEEVLNLCLLGQPNPNERERLFKVPTHSEISHCLENLLNIIEVISSPKWLVEAYQQWSQQVVGYLVSKIVQAYESSLASSGALEPYENAVQIFMTYYAHVSPEAQQKLLMSMFSMSKNAAFFAKEDQNKFEQIIGQQIFFPAYPVEVQ